MKRNISMYYINNRKEKWGKENLNEPLIDVSF